MAEPAVELAFADSLYKSAEWLFLMIEAYS
jgi:hypothetical protein